MVVADDPAFVDRDALRLSEQDAPAFAAYALRTRAVGARDVLAHLAGRSGGTSAELVDAVGHRGAGAFVAPVWAAWFAYVEALLPTTDAATAVLLLEAAAQLAGPQALPSRVADVRAQVLVRAGRADDAAAALATTPVSAPVRWEVECDLANPGLWPDGSGDETRWLELLSRPFVSGGMEPLTLSDAGATPFRRLLAVPGGPALASSGDGSATRGLVSVVMSAYRPDRDIITACRSILDQSWTDLELLVVDDASPPGSEDLLAEVEALDGRIRLLRAPSNGGTYAVRNLALAEAAGEFVTFQDSDDWSHPRRIEVQVRALLEDPDLLATRTRAIRAYPDLSLTFPGYPAQRPNASSLLFRRAEVRELIGDFDAVRKSADMEYPQRLEAVRPGSVRDVDSHGPLAITQLRSGSLSRADAVPGWIRWTRVAYRDAWAEWHDRIRHFGADPHLPAPDRRPFPVPDPAWSPSATAPVTEGRFDVTLLGDWRTGRAPRRQLLDELGMLSAAGLRVGLAQAEAPFPLPAKRQPRARQVQRLINAGVVELTHLDRPAEGGLLLVADLDVLTYLPDVPIAMAPSAVGILVDDETAIDDALPDADRAVRGAFGVQPVWLARHDRALEALRRHGSGLHIARDVLPYGVDAAGLRVTPHRLLGPAPVMGHHLPDEPERWPDRRQVLLGAYPAEGVDVRLLHGTTSAARIISRRDTHPVGWLSYDDVDVPTRTFLSQLDFFVYLGRRDHIADHAIREAMVAGCVPVVTDQFRDVTGEGALYVAETEETVAERVAQLAADPAAYRRLQDGGAAAVVGADFVERIRRLLPVVRRR